MRVRLNKNIARIEILSDDFGKIMEQANKRKIVENFKKLVFKYICLDLEGYSLSK